MKPVLGRIFVNLLSSRSGDYLGAAVFAAALLGYSNATAWLAERDAGRASQDELDGIGRELGGPSVPHLAMLLFSFGWANATGLTPRQLGLGASGVGGSLLCGLAVGAFGSILIRLFFGILGLVGRPVRLPEFHGLGPWRLAWVLAQYFLGSAFFEEVAFRGVLRAQLVRVLGTQKALLAGSAVFALWHALITWYNLRRSGLPGALFPALYSGTMGVLVLAGLIFGALREITGHLAGAILAHWLMVASIVLSVKGSDRDGASGGRRDGA